MCEYSYILCGFFFAFSVTVCVITNRQIILLYIWFLPFYITRVFSHLSPFHIDTIKDKWLWKFQMVHVCILSVWAIFKYHMKMANVKNNNTQNEWNWGVSERGKESEKREHNTLNLIGTKNKSKYTWPKIHSDMVCYLVGFSFHWFSVCRAAGSRY